MGEWEIVHQLVASSLPLLINLKKTGKDVMCAYVADNEQIKNGHVIDGSEDS